VLLLVVFLRLLSIIIWGSIVDTNSPLPLP
jgi:hypothetical protein